MLAVTVSGNRFKTGDLLRLASGAGLSPSSYAFSAHAKLRRLKFRIRRISFQLNTLSTHLANRAGVAPSICMMVHSLVPNFSVAAPDSEN